MRGINHNIQISAAEVGAAKTALVLPFLSEEAEKCRRETFPRRALPLCKHSAAEFGQCCLQRLQN